MLKLTNIKLSDTQLPNMVQLQRFLPLPLIFPALKIGKELLECKISKLAKNGAKVQQNSF